MTVIFTVDLHALVCRNRVGWAAEILVQNLLDRARQYGIEEFD
jgi:hypothetical protein